MKSSSTSEVSHFSVLSQTLSKSLERVHQFTKSFEREVQKKEIAASQLVSTVCRRMEQSFHRVVATPANRVAFASISGNFDTNGGKIFRRDVQQKISNVPVYLVAKDNGKLVYIKPESGKLKKPIGLVFMSMQSAKELLAKIHSDVPEFAEDTNVVRLDLGHLYELFTDGQLAHLKNVIFRFVPDKEQVINAMEVLQSSGSRVRGFTGVPLFHVSGLNAGEDAKRPYFLQKEDLDYAIELASQKKLQRDRNVLKEDMEILKKEAKEARVLAKQTDGRQSQNWLTIAARADSKSARLSKQMNALGDSLGDSVKVEVRSLESLLSEMENETTAQIDETIIIPAGLTKHQLLGGSSPNFKEKPALDI